MSIINSMLERTLAVIRGHLAGGLQRHQAVNGLGKRISAGNTRRL
jgi:hypothetical protein